ncbi:GOLGA2 family protein [Megaselia abdita]
MADRARKLAAAKKKLKAYQENHGANVVEDVAVEPTPSPQQPTPPPPQVVQETVLVNSESPPEQKSVDVIEMLISEKSQIASELAHFKSLAEKKQSDLEELLDKYKQIVKRSEELEAFFSQEQRVKDELRDYNERLTRETSQMRIKVSEQSDYIEELKNCLAAEKQKSINKTEISEEIKTNTNQETVDSRVESLMQTKFMYEQQIRDLQAMVQQMTLDKEQSNQQYQNYASHLNQEITSLNEKNAELTEQVSKLEAREKGLIDHVSGLEKQIQHNLKQQQQQTDNKEEESKKLAEEISELKSQIDSMNEEKMVFQLKIKSQEDQLEAISREILTPKEEGLERVYNPEEDKKLLEKMESDKIAASRALIQNAELKQQLDELQMKFIELTNDKVDLMTKLDSEMFSNKQYHQLKDDIDSLTEKLHYKDEEMIRLSHENNDLKLENMELKHGKKVSSEIEDYECGDHNSHEGHHHGSDEEGHNHHESSDQHNECHHHEPNDHHHESHEDHAHESHEHQNSDHQKMEHSEVLQEKQPSPHSTPRLPPEAAMRKLEVRFTKLMSEVADLTDDKQRLEHLVLQLQGETETIGEYISLYQTQRRVLKQRDYERSNYLQKIESERQELLRKMAYLNKLLAGLGIDLPLEAREESVIEPEPIANGYEDKQQVLQKIQSIIHEMQEKSIIKDDLTKCGSGGSIAIDHCSFCSGTLETV